MGGGQGVGGAKEWVDGERVRRATDLEEGLCLHVLEESDEGVLCGACGWGGHGAHRHTRHQQ